MPGAELPAVHDDPAGSPREPWRIPKDFTLRCGPDWIVWVAWYHRPRLQTVSLVAVTTGPSYRVFSGLEWTGRRFRLTKGFDKLEAHDVNAPDVLASYLAEALPPPPRRRRRASV
jgi:hypothetical protein